MNVLISKLEAYGLDVGSINFLLDNLSLRNHRTKVGSSYSKWSEICPGMSISIKAINYTAKLKAILCYRHKTIFYLNMLHKFL